MNYSDNAWDIVRIIKDDYNTMSGCGIGPINSYNLAECLDLPYISENLTKFIDMITSKKLSDIKKLSRMLSSMTLDEAISNSLAI